MKLVLGKLIPESQYVRVFWACLLSTLLLTLPTSLSMAANGGLLDFLGGVDEPAPVVAPEKISRGVDQVYEELVENGFQNVVVNADSNSGQLNVELYHGRISEMDRVIGRAARIIDIFAPEDYNKLNVCYYDDGVLCAMCYVINRDKLTRYFNRLMSRWQLRHYVKKGLCTSSQLSKNIVSIETGARVHSSASASASADVNNSIDISEPVKVSTVEEKAVTTQGVSLSTLVASTNNDVLVAGRVADRVESTSSTSSRSLKTTVNTDKLDNDLLAGYNLYHSNNLTLSAHPVDLGRYLNDADGDAFFDVRSSLVMDAYLDNGWGFHSDIFYRWSKSDDVVSSNSQLQHVRSDIDLYRDERAIKIDRLYASYSTRLGLGSAFVATLGYQEEMFAGVSTQAYFPSIAKDLDLDIRLDWVKQREIEDAQSLSDYHVTSGVVGLRYKALPFLNDVSIYAGRFLAKDSGMRLQLGHSFRNGVKLSLWYSHTDGEDKTGPGSESSPYRSHGVTLSIPLGSVRRKDTKKSYNFEYVPHMRDTAQMLDRPMDLSHSASRWSVVHNGLQRFGQ